MGEFVGDHDIYIASLLELLNIRFGPSEPAYRDISGIKEMADLQREFTIFSEAHSLRDIVAVLNLAGHSDWTLKGRWYKLLENLARNYPPGQPDQSADKRIVRALKENLESHDPRPVHFTAHDSGKNRDVIIKNSDPEAVFYIKKNFITISLPMKARKEKAD